MLAVYNLAQDAFFTPDIVQARVLPPEYVFVDAHHEKDSKIRIEETICMCMESAYFASLSETRVVCNNTHTRHKT
jgi:hypothetical protein